MNNFSNILASGLSVLGLESARSAIPKMLEYLVLLDKWNKTFNLTAIREPEKMLTHHLLDSLAVVPYIPGKTIIDIGSGAGLPGIPIALSRPECKVTLLDSNQKKVTFLRQACIQLSLGNVTVSGDRAESWCPEVKYEVAISRAFSDLTTFVRVAAHLCQPGGVMLAMKGTYPSEELEQLPSTVTLEEVIPLIVPELGAERHLVVMRVK